MREGGLDAAFFSIFISGEITGPQAIRRALEGREVAKEISIRLGSAPQEADDGRPQPSPQHMAELGETEEGVVGEVEGVDHVRVIAVRVVEVEERAARVVREVLVQLHIADGLIVNDMNGIMEGKVSRKRKPIAGRRT